MQQGQVRRMAQFTSVAGFQMNLINIIAAVIGAGVLERYPNIRLGFGESGIGWIPYALDRMDFEFEDRFRDLMKLKPSEYWRRQCKATFQFDRIGPKLIDEMGVETLMWGSDYPHPDGVWPESSKYIEEQFAGLPADTIHKITCENAANSTASLIDEPLFASWREADPLQPAPIAKWLPLPGDKRTNHMAYDLIKMAACRRLGCAFLPRRCRGEGRQDRRDRKTLRPGYAHG